MHICICIYMEKIVNATNMLKPPVFGSFGRYLFAHLLKQSERQRGRQWGHSGRQSGRQKRKHSGRFSGRQAGRHSSARQSGGGQRWRQNGRQVGDKVGEGLGDIVGDKVGDTVEDKAGDKGRDKVADKLGHKVPRFPEPFACMRKFGEGAMIKTRQLISAVGKNSLGNSWQFSFFILQYTSAHNFTIQYTSCQSKGLLRLCAKATALWSRRALDAP